MSQSSVVALEIGTTKTVAIRGEMREDRSLSITAMGECPTKGVRKGEVIDFENALVCARTALQEAENSGQTTIRDVYVAVSGGHIQSMVSDGSTPVNPSGVIAAEDVERAMAVARAINLPPDRELLHTICQRFYVDNDKEGVIRPEGMEGAKLSVNVLALYGARSRLRQTIRAVQSVPMEITDVAFGGLCSAMAALTGEQKENGVVLIDLGGGTTDYIAYANGTMVAAGALGVGGDHVTNDIAQAFGISVRQAERIKKEAGGAIVDPSGHARRIPVPEEVGFAARNIPLNGLQTVIHARLHETISMIKSRVEGGNLLQHVGTGVVLTGGGARMRDVAELGEQVFGMPCTVGAAKGVTGIPSAITGPEYAAPIGLVRFAFRSPSIHREGGGLLDGVRRILGLEKRR